MEAPNLSDRFSRFGMLIAAQLRAGRALIRWDLSASAKAAEVSIETISGLERMDGSLGPSRVATVDATRYALAAAGVERVPENGGGVGVRLKTRGGTAP